MNEGLNDMTCRTSVLQAVLNNQDGVFPLFCHKIHKVVQTVFHVFDRHWRMIWRSPLSSVWRARAYEECDSHGYGRSGRFRTTNDCKVTVVPRRTLSKMPSALNDYLLFQWNKQ